MAIYFPGDFMKFNRFILCALSVAAFSMAACGGDDNDNNNENQPCTANVCKDASILLECKDGVETPVTCQNGCENNACKTAPAPVDNQCTYTEPKCNEANNAVLTCKDGVESSSPCENGCENGSCKTAPVENQCTYTEPKCNEANNAVLTCKDGVESSENCAKGCADGKCIVCTEATEKADCGDNKICVNGACSDPECTQDKCSENNLLACSNGRLAAASNDNKCENKCVADAMGDGKDACVGADYCKTADDCRDREDGKTTCMTSEHRCESFACSNANCKDTEVCVLGACVLKADLDAEAKTECNPETFVDHCRGDNLATCALYSKSIENKKCDEDGNVCVYQVILSNCVDTFYKLNGCAAYKDGLKIVSQCIESRSPDDICGNAPSATECVDKNSWSEITTYACIVSTEGKKIAVETKSDVCPDEGVCAEDGKSCE